MEAQTLMLGDVDIRSYVKSPANLSQKRKQNIESELASIQKNNFASEKHAYNLLYSEMISQDYPEMDLSFLNKNYEKNFGTYKKTISLRGFFSSAKYQICDRLAKVPAFAIYNLYGENKFSIHVSTENSPRVLFDPIQPSIIAHQVLKSLDFGKGSYTINKIMRENEKNEIWYNFDEKINFFDNIPPLSLYYRFFGGSFKIENRKYERFEIMSTFNGLIPKKIKETIEEAKKHFKKEIYLIEEVKPEKWEIPKESTVRIKKVMNEDPLVIGLIGDKAHLITHFDCTPLENLVKDVYVGRNN